MAKINLNPEDLQELRTINPRLIHLARALGEAYLVINTS